MNEKINKFNIFQYIRSIDIAGLHNMLVLSCEICSVILAIKHELYSWSGA